MDVGASPLEADPVNENRSNFRRVFLLSDERIAGEITSDQFEPEWWRTRRAELGHASGRGTVMFVRAPDGQRVWVLRHYLRGGWMARLTRDRYFWTGLDKTRAWREWRLTKRLRDLALPVPMAIGARVIRRGIFYTADLLTERIEHVETLGEILRTRALAAEAWRKLGATLRRFHDAGVRHDDLNVSNILVDVNGGFHVIDFDKAALARPGAWMEANLARFRRSLDKHRALASSFAFSEANWNALLAGYAGPAPRRRTRFDPLSSNG
jgi:3-deoxy-D-manno-octulosonic acid kinase